MSQDSYQDLIERIQQLENEIAEISNKQNPFTKTSYQELIKHAPICIHDIDLHGKLMSMNPAGLAMVNIPADSIYGIPYLDFIGEHHRAHVETLLERALKGETISQFQFTIKTHEGTKTFESNFIPILSEDGYMQKLMGVTIDITEKIRTADNLMKAKNQAERANMAKSELLANVSHELRTPMNGLLGAAELLKDDPRGEHQQELTTIIYNSAQSLMALIDSFLDLSTLDVQRLIPSQKPFNPTAVLKNVFNNLDSVAENLAIKFDMRFKQELPPSVIGDPVRLSQILFNLVGNAFKFTPKGSINVIVDWQASTRENILAIRVIDTGIGIALADQNKIFETFTRLDMSSTKSQQGVGLGLSICKQLCDLMGGSLTVDSQVGCGSTFTLKLPLEVDTSLSRVESVPISYQRNYQKKVLLAEDNPINQKIASRMLQKLGIEISLAENGEEAVRCCQQKEFDLVLMDIRMPILDGLLAAKQLRQMEAMNSVPIIAYTASSKAEMSSNRYSEDMQGYLAKPLTLTNLINELDKWFISIGT